LVPEFSDTFIDEIQTPSGETWRFNNIDGTRRGVSGTTSESILSLRESRKKFRVKRDWGLLYIVSAWQFRCCNWDCAEIDGSAVSI